MGKQTWEDCNASKPLSFLKAISRYLTPLCLVAYHNSKSGHSLAARQVYWHTHPTLADVNPRPPVYELLRTVQCATTFDVAALRVDIHFHRKDIFESTTKRRLRLREKQCREWEAAGCPQDKIPKFIDISSSEPMVISVLSFIGLLNSRPGSF